MFISKRRLELEKRVAKEDLLWDIIKCNQEGEPYRYVVNRIGYITEKPQVIYEIRVKQVAPHRKIK